MKSIGTKAGIFVEQKLPIEEGREAAPTSLTGSHIWYVCSHARPTHCNFCREKLSGMAWHGLSCEVCRMKAHKRCATSISDCCKWKYESSITNDVKVFDANGLLQMPHQWIEGNLPIGCKCFVCERTCGSVLKLQDWRCLWCGSYAHEQCKASAPKVCALGPIRLSILPPLAIKCVNKDGEADIQWECLGGDYGGGSPLLVLVNSKSGENQGMRILAKFKRLLNPAQVIDIISTGPNLGLKFFRKFDSFRVLVCGGDGTVGWVLSAVDSLDLLSKARILPLGTGNDLARVLGWGRAFDDESQLLHVIEKFERAHTRMLDRWSVMTSSADTSYAELKKAKVLDIEKHESCINELLDGIESADDESAIFCASRILYETVREFIILVKQTLAAFEQEKFVDNGFVVNQDDADLTKLENVLRSLETPLIYSSEYREVPSEQISVDSSVSYASIKAKSQRELLLKRENSLKKAVKQLTQNAKALALKMKKDNRGSVHLKREHFRKKRSRTAPGNGKKCGINGKDASGGSLLSLHSQMPFTNFSGIVDRSLENIYSVCTTPLSSVPAVLPTVSVSSPSHKSVKSCNASILTQLKLPSIGDVEPPTPNRTPTTVGSPLALPLKWLEGESSIEENDDFLAAELPIGNISRSLSDSISPGKCSSPNESLSYLQLSPIDASNENYFSFDTNLLKRQIYRNMKSKSDSSICHRSSGPEYPISKSNFIPISSRKGSLVASLPGKKGVFVEKKVMNNYFGIGLDAKIALEFHNKREELPDKARSRSKLFMWYGMLGGKELLLRTFKNLDQRIRLECDGQLMQLPSLQGIVILNIPSYSGGANFWGSKKESGDCTFAAQSFDDRMLEVVALFGVIHVATSRVPRLPLQKHRIAQCRHVNIVVSGNEPIPVQVDGEPWLQPPGVIEIVYKNRAQMLVHDPVFEATLRIWQEQNKVTPTTPTAVVHQHFPSMDIPSLFIEAAARLTDLLDFTQPEVCEAFSDKEIDKNVAEANCAISSALGCSCIEVNDPRMLEVIRTVRTLIEGLQPVLNRFSETESGKVEWFGKLSEAISSVREDLEKVERLLAEYGPSGEEAKEHASGISGSITVETLKNDARVRPRVKSRVAQWFRSKWGRRRRRAASADAVSVITWNVEAVCAWMTSMGFKDYSRILRSNNIDGKELLRLRTSDFKQIGFNDSAQLIRFQNAINDLKRHVGGGNKGRLPHIEKDASSWTAKSNTNEASASSF